MTDDWFDLLVALLESDARFLVVGAHAMAVHGVPRGTQDLDVWIDPDGSNADRVWAALTAFGAPLATLAIGRDDLQRPGTVIQLGVAPNRIDLLTSLSGLDEFGKAWGGRLEQVVRGRRIPFLGRRELLSNKRASGRRKDLADIEALGEDPGDRQ